MGITPATAAKLAEMREWAADPQAWVWPVQGRAIFPADVVGKSDTELLEFIRQRINEQ